MVIKTLLIDIGNVLVGLNYERPLSTIKHSTGFPEDEIQNRLHRCPDLDLYETGKLGTDEFFGRILGLFELDLPLEEFKEAWSDIFVFWENGHDLFSPELFRGLKNKYRLVALSNTNELHFDYLLMHCPLLNEFDDYVLSYQVGCMKPDERIYRTALRRSHCSSSEAIFVDDRVENVRAAEELGIAGIVFAGEKALRKQFQSLGIA